MSKSITIGEKLKNIASYKPLEINSSFTHKSDDGSAAEINVRTSDARFFIVEAVDDQIPRKFEVFTDEGDICFVEYKEPCESSIHSRIKLTTSDLTDCVAFLLVSNFEIFESSWCLVALSKSYVNKEPILYDFVKFIEENRAKGVRDKAMHYLKRSQSEDFKKLSKPRRAIFYREIDEELLFWFLSFGRLSIERFGSFLENEVFRAKFSEEEGKVEEHEEGEAKEGEGEEGEGEEEEEEEEEEEDSTSSSSVNTSSDTSGYLNDSNEYSFFNPIPSKELIFEVAVVTNNSGKFERPSNFYEILSSMNTEFKKEGLYVGDEQSKTNFMKSRFEKPDEDLVLKKNILLPRIEISHSTRVKLSAEGPNEVFFLPKQEHKKFVKELREKEKCCCSSSAIEMKMYRDFITKKIDLRFDFFSGEINDFKEEVRKDIKDFKEEVKEEFKEVRKDINDFKEEVKEEFKEVKEDIKEVKEDIKGLREEMKFVVQMLKSLIPIKPVDTMIDQIY